MAFNGYQNAWLIKGELREGRHLEAAHEDPEKSFAGIRLAGQWKGVDDTHT